MKTQNKKQIATFIDEQEISNILEQAKTATDDTAKNIIEKGRNAKGLTPYETAVLLQNKSNEISELLFDAAHEVKEKIYGKRLVFFAPLYISNYCINNCVYCGYRKDNQINRRRLKPEEIELEIIALEAMGHKRIALETGEDPINCPLEYVLESIHKIYSVKEKLGSIRRINVNIAATTVENYKRLKDAGIGTYILFQETYHRETYKKMHPHGPKSDYDWHTTAMDRAMEAGIDDVGFGVLFGLYDYKFDVLGLLLHSLHLEERFGVGCHTISVPRMRPATGVNLTTFPYLVNDNDFKRIIAIIRLAVPYTGMILSTREPAHFRDEILSIGISQLSAGSCTGVGGYHKDIERHQVESNGQFQVEDQRNTDEVLRSVCESGYIPSFCTACYRTGRTGDRFMPLAKSGEIQNVCQPNAILTFKEFLLDYASEETKKIGDEAIQKHLKMIPRPHIRKETEDRLKRLERGERDLYF
ncbi:MAG TPA: [FeFe] hydrogenase H-cluster radical SAM maturase HydG [Syntrophorhabdaceae bacterium]|nr:[FeFe] hydrogenase H-cluster radical SAM maturase HydG [Syntrophorhabdaceae bacterium]HOF58070.1 [FeFe] hydrogenase H-cluster radical SAM maturase HydG [Syntrophorhabdaceae bacterium]HOS06070.1 [FeFe] hydrogenase H-cluster radical SAM maturase HydG [Syntrophorhabdaceae bacterium]HPH41441.1 [FeFe] hydrogenase H-cluster radical SAM maturase HydG [Syntrophorhabdaceae bacterium]HPL41252.1 [FeFe] hydrogenase H-cluster radical SAM maturase HydG [Syntrophorhabdaceae bacterium]